MSQPTTLLIDNSNSRSKFILAQAGQLRGEMRILPTAELSASTLAELLHDWQVEQVLVASVVPHAQEIFRSYFSTQPLHFLSAESAHGLDLSLYEGRATLGADRIANAAALVRLGHYPAISIDLGTAVTYEVVDLIDCQPRFLGGLIAPGFNTLRRSLASSTAQLPHVRENEESSALAQTTAAAIHAGCLIGLRGMVRETLNELCKQLERPPFIIATGGDAPVIYPYLDKIHQIEPRLNLLGLASLAQQIQF